MEKFKLINGWTKERVLEQVKKYNKGLPATVRNQACAYLTEDGNRCAVGCFIPDGHPSLRAGNTASVGDLLREYPELMENMPFTEGAAIAQFQGAHDACSSDNPLRSKDVYAAVTRFLEESVE